MSDMMRIDGRASVERFVLSMSDATVTGFEHSELEPWLDSYVCGAFRTLNDDSYIKLTFLDEDCEQVELTIRNSRRELSNVIAGLISRKVDLRIEIAAKEEK